MRNIYCNETQELVRFANEPFIGDSTTLVKYAPNAVNVRLERLGLFCDSILVSVPNYPRYFELPGNVNNMARAPNLDFSIMPSTVKTAMFSDPVDISNYADMRDSASHANSITCHPGISKPGHLLSPFLQSANDELQANISTTSSYQQGQAIPLYSVKNKRVPAVSVELRAATIEDKEDDSIAIYDNLLWSKLKRVPAVFYDTTDSSNFYDFTRENYNSTSARNCSVTCQSNGIFAEYDGRVFNKQSPRNSVQNSASFSVKIYNVRAMLPHDSTENSNEANCRSRPRYSVQICNDSSKDMRKSVLHYDLCEFPAIFTNDKIPASYT